jgi:hypothetical protein
VLVLALMAIHPAIQQWQSSRHEIGIIEFGSSADALKRFPHLIPHGYTPIGTVEAELLCIEDATGEVLEFEHEVADRICCRCAASQDQFIEAIRVLEDYFARCVESDNYADDEAAGLDAINRAAEAAGGSRYAPMYHSMVGY